MNNIKLVLKHFASGKTIKSISQFTDIPVAEIKQILEECKVEKPSDAFKVLDKMADHVITKKMSEGVKEVNHSVVETPKVEGHKHQFNFNREEAVRRDSHILKPGYIPDTSVQEFKRDMIYLSWAQVVERWTKKENLTEEQIREEAIRIVPTFYQRKTQDESK